MEEYAQQLSRDLTAWNTSMEDKRKRFHFLNFFNVRHIIKLLDAAQMFARGGTASSPASFLVLSLLLSLMLICFFLLHAHRPRFAI